MTAHKVNYAYFNREYGPYLRVFFYNPKDGKRSVENLAILDSGSNNIIIPFSIGRAINLNNPESLEDFKRAHGVGGAVSFVEKPCVVYLINEELGEMYGFWDNVVWEHPPEVDFIEKIEKIERSVGRKKALIEKMEKENKGDSRLVSIYKKAIGQKNNKIKELTDRFEKSGVILGRSFLNNFEYVKFHQRGSNGHFLYKIKESKINRTGKYPDDMSKLTP
ncbi:MAG: hypothetical protein Q8Q06_00640 [bacterium]|nr:hypothetical protein [bacterium]